MSEREERENKREYRWTPFHDVTALEPCCMPVISSQDSHFFFFVLCQPLWTCHSELSLAPLSTGPRTSMVKIHVKLKIDVCSSVLHSLEQLGGSQVTAWNSGWFGGYVWWNLRRLCWWNNGEVHWKVLAGELFFPFLYSPRSHSQPAPKSNGYYN